MAYVFKRVSGGLAAAFLSAGVILGGGGGAAGMVGGACTYEDFSGQVVITGIVQTPASSAQANVVGGPGYPGFEVTYRFTPDVPLADAGAAEWAAGQHEFRLANSWYPGEKYIAKYGLGTMRGFTATLKVRKTGACTPYLIELKGVDPTDYFESR